MNKKILLMVGGALLVVIIAVGGLLYSNSKKQQAANQPVDQGTPADSSGTGSGSDTTSNTVNAASKVKKLSDSAAIAPALSFDSQAVWYFTADGHLYKVNVSTGLKQEFLLPSKLAISGARWPDQGNNFIVISGAGDQKSFYYYDSSAKDSAQKFITFPSAVKNMDFKDQNQIVYIWADDKGASLEIGTPDMKTYAVIVSLPEKNLNILVSPKGDRALLYNADNSGDGKLYLVSFSDKKLITLKTSTENGAVWLNDGRYFVYNRDDGSGAKNSKLWIGDSESSSDHEMGINSSVSKVASDKSGANIFVAAKDGNSDSVWKIDSVTLVKTKSFNSADAGDTQVSMTEPFISADSASIYFKNTDGFIYSAPLK